MSMSEGSFVWYELVTSDAQAASEFYAKVMDWKISDSGMTDIRYLLAHVGERHVAGLMDFPPDMPNPRAAWFGYIAVADVDAMADRVKQAGGAVHRAPADIPGVGRFAVVADPQGAVFMLFRGEGSPPADLPQSAAGNVGWHELHSSDWEAGFAFYRSLFGWEKATPVDMGEMGTYQLFSTTGIPAPDEMAAGGMMTNPHAPAPFWLYYVNVGDIDAALARITDAGGTLQMGPIEVPGGMWIVQAFDPQGAMFAVVGNRG